MKRAITQDDLDGIWDVNNKLYITHARTHVASLKSIVDLMGRVIRSRSPLYWEATGWAAHSMEETKLGKLIRSSLSIDLKELERHFPKHRFHPFFVIYKRYFSKFYGRWDWRDRSLVHQLNAAVEKVRAWGRGRGIKRRLDNMRRTERANWRQARKLLGAQRLAYSKTLAIRLDLGYVSTHSNGSFRSAGVTYAEAAGHRAQFLDYLRDGSFKDVRTGYVWKMEYGMEKGFHLHIALLMDGQKVCKDISIATALGEHWKTVITGGKGGYFNCNQKKEAYKRCGLGNLSRHDDVMWEDLEEAVRYLTKQDLFIRLKVPPKARTFGVGGVYKKK